MERAKLLVDLVRSVLNSSSNTGSIILVFVPKVVQSMVNILEEEGLIDKVINFTFFTLIRLNINC